MRLRDEVDKERTERNFFQLERDKVNSFWEISQHQLDEARATIRNKERELSDSEERHQVEIKVRITLQLRVIIGQSVTGCMNGSFVQVYKQKVKHLLYEHQNNITELKRDSENTCTAIYTIAYLSLSLSLVV